MWDRWIGKISKALQVLVNIYIIAGVVFAIAAYFNIIPNRLDPFSRGVTFGAVGVLVLVVVAQLLSAIRKLGIERATEIAFDYVREDDIDAVHAMIEPDSRELVNGQWQIKAHYLRDTKILTDVEIAVDAKSKKVTKIKYTTHEHDLFHGHASVG